MIGCKQYDKAVKRLPMTVSSYLLPSILHHSELKKFLVEQRSEWLETQETIGPFDDYEEDNFDATVLTALSLQQAENVHGQSGDFDWPILLIK